MGCVCCSLSSFVSIVLQALERVSLCTVCAMLTCCLVFTILSVMIMGIGIGFHYCAVQNAVEAMEKAAKSAGALRSGESPGSPALMRTVNQAVKRGFAHRLNKRDKADMLMPTNNNTINDEILSRRNFTSENDTNNDNVWFGGNFKITSHRMKRDLTQDIHLPVNNTTNDVLFNMTIITNGSLGYADDKIGRNSSIETLDEGLSDAPVPSNNTIYDAIALRQNCTLLNYFSLFF